MQCTCIDIYLSSNMPVSICSMHCDEFSLTMIENLRHASPSPTPERNCRRSVFSHINTMRELNGQRSMLVRRKRLKLRRLVKSESNDHCAKRKRTEESENEEFSKKIKSDKASLTLSSAESNKLVENDIIIDESSSYVDEEDRETEKKRRFTFWSHGSISLIGRRREMEDAVAVQLGFLKRGLKKYDFFGVYDGHGGSRVAYSCRERLHRLLVNVVEGGGGGEGNDFAEKGMINWEKVMAASFRRMDEEVNKGGSSVAMMGSTAVVAVVGEEELVVANCGDSRAVLSRDGVAIALSDDHKPDRPDELERIEVSGGKVINWNGHRVLGVLATSRSIGDHYLKPFVIPEPEVRVSKRTDKDEFLILGCDGLWDVVSNDIACQIVRRCLNHRREVIDEDAGSRAAQAAAILAELAIARGSRDNISVIVIELKKFRRSNTNLNGW